MCSEFKMVKKHKVDYIPEKFLFPGLSFTKSETHGILETVLMG